MLRFTFRRLLQIIPVLWIIITATFFMIRFVPGGPFPMSQCRQWFQQSQSRRHLNLSSLNLTPMMPAGKSRHS